MSEVWDYSKRQPFAYGEETTYRLAMELLADCETVEDWGCGTAWASRYCAGSYLGVDSSPGFADVVADLTTYTSECDGVLLRHVLEHNEEWRAILANAVASARKRLVVVLFTQMAEETHVVQRSHGVPDIAFADADLAAFFEGHPIQTQDLTTATQYGRERIYLVKLDEHSPEPAWTSRLGS